MDLLGSILGQMDAPPTTTVDENTKKRVKEAKRKAAQFKEMERERKETFRNKIEERVNKFLQGPGEERKMTFGNMHKIERSIAHEVAETAGLCAYSFGEEDVDRHLVVWKKEYAPSDEELEAVRNGEEYDPLSAGLAAEAIKASKANEIVSNDDQELIPRKRKSINKEPEKYFEKYAKIVGDSSGVKAAHITKSNKAYGMVPSKNKEDKRSIEETMKEIRERKKQQQQQQQKQHQDQEQEQKQQQTTLSDTS